MIGLIVSGGQTVNSELIKKYHKLSDICIAVDKGAELLLKLNLDYTMAVGDFDSISEKYFEIVKEQKKIITLDKEKDLSDTEYAIEYLANLGVHKLFIISATGSRLDHSMTNIFYLKKLYEKNIESYIIDDNNRIRICDSECQVYNEYENVSIVPLTLEGIKVTLNGFYFKLNEDFIEFGSSRCLSNYLVNNTGIITIISGIAYIIESKD